ncbi:F420H(2)-dependent quinone reductase [Nocardia seriolae]|uniref:F420H(2)-dependent quinone reductase n=1 Tax=Nocardia seriolae TaxID=37332 RepID=A0ABC8ARM3_9NOCA|nr:nitroreductase family deazaflavin-dependent oxidoreductase [Nocardia seriolae]APA96742.1 F420H(2)-dependent quinone reductase [Nocardia seriolae]
MGAERKSVVFEMFGDSDWFAGVGKKLAVADLFLQRRTGGRFGLLTLAKLPNIVLTTTGRKTGLPRHACLIYVPRGEDYVIVDSNWGQSRRPEWSANLLANPRAQILERGHRTEVHARHLTGTDRDEVWGELLEK